jgi:hypothetical protein
VEIASFLRASASSHCYWPESFMLGKIFYHGFHGWETRSFLSVLLVSMEICFYPNKVVEPDPKSKSSNDEVRADRLSPQGLLYPHRLVGRIGAERDATQQCLAVPPCVNGAKDFRALPAKLFYSSLKNWLEPDIGMVS